MNYIFKDACKAGFVAKETVQISNDDPPPPHGFEMAEIGNERGGALIPLKI